MFNATEQVAQHQRGTHSFTQGAIRPLGALEHLFWLLDKNRPVHFAIASLPSGPSACTKGKFFSITSETVESLGATSTRVLPSSACRDAGSISIRSPQLEARRQISTLPSKSTAGNSR
jgi:hypothetical protein